MVTRVSADRKSRIDEQLTSCLFQTGKPLSMFDDDCWIQFFQKNFGYTPPHSKTILGPLLDKVYESAKTEVKAELSSSPFLGLIMDESTNINQNRIINTSVVTNTGNSFYWKNTEAEEGKLGAKELAAHAIRTGEEITDGDLTRWTSFTLDTCSTMRATWTNIEQDPRSKHVITVPCDSHGLQLLIKDILQRPSIKKIWQIAANIVTAFKNASKQYAYLRVEQEKEYGKRKPMIVTCNTRWGTQYGMVKSLNDSKEALRTFAIRDEVQFPYKSQLQDQEFWAATSDLLQLLKPIHRVQKMSEANRANISYVYPRWMEIELHLHQIANSKNAFAADIHGYLNGIDKKSWTRRRNKQLKPIHLAAYFLHPDNYHVPITSEQQLEMRELFKRHTLDYETALDQFFDFRAQSDSFGKAGGSWDHTSKPGLFWRYQAASSPELSAFARIVLTVIGNSVPSERAFSTMNYIHSKRRNCLDLERTDKLQFLHMNLLVLAKQKKSREPTDEELLAWEDEFQADQALE
jgi:hypothetical protein